MVVVNRSVRKNLSRSLCWGSVKLFPFVGVYQRLIIVNVFGHKKFFSDLRQRYLLTIYLCVIHSTFELVVDRWVDWIAFFIIFFLKSACRSQILQFCLIQTPSLLDRLFFILLHPVCSSLFQIHIKFISVFHQCTKFEL
jgi:hypothetical protein